MKNYETVIQRNEDKKLNDYLNQGTECCDCKYRNECDFENDSICKLEDEDDYENPWDRVDYDYDRMRDEMLEKSLGGK